jgi:hypothetical protein
MEDAKRDGDNDAAQFFKPRNKTSNGSKEARNC